MSEKEPSPKPSPINGNILTRELSSKGGKVSSPAKTQANRLNPVVHGKTAKYLPDSIRLCSDCQFNTHCPQADQDGRNRCSIDIKRFKNMLKIGVEFSVRSFAVSYIQVLNSMMEDVFKVCDEIEKLKIIIGQTQKEVDEQLENFKDADKEDEREYYKQQRMLIRFRECHQGYVRMKNQNEMRLFTMKDTILKKTAECKKMVLGDKVTVEQKIQVDAIIMEYEATLKMMVDKYQAPEAKG